MKQLEKFRNMLDMEEYPLAFFPEEWCDFSEANCYVYAIGLKTNSPMLIGDFIGRRMTYKNSIDEQIAVLRSELEYLGFYVDVCEPNDLVDDETTIQIYIEWNQNGQYHFYRKDDNGRWSHKARGVEPKDVDEFGRFIFNPEEIAYCGICFALSRV